MNYSLSREFPSVDMGVIRTYGGSQMNADSRTMREVGCGVIAALDLLIYLLRKESLNGSPLVILVKKYDPIPLLEYNKALESLRRHYLPVIPRHGINGLMLALGMNRYFLRYRMPYRASWGVPFSCLWQRIGTMIQEDIPVILSVGPNFPFFWQHKRVNFYFRQTDGKFIPGPQTHSHYVTVTGMDEHWLQISSWGHKYYISRKEYLEYVRCHSTKLVSNVLYVKRKGHGD